MFFALLAIDLGNLSGNFPGMTTLVLGGTQFIGRHIVETLLGAGHRVTILTRGKSPDALPGKVERLRGDRDQGRLGLEALEGRSWDVCVDVCGYTAKQVRPSTEMLRDRAERYLFISAVSVYGDTQDRPVRETHPRLPPAGDDVTEIDSTTYGPLKVTCENIVEQAYPGRSTLLRPQIVVGPHDPSGRYSYWIQRAERGGEMLAPGDGSDHLQVIDVRDLARFVRTAIENTLTGAFNLAGPRITWTEFVKLLGAESVAWVPAEIIQRAGVSEFKLPLFRPERGTRSGLMDICNQRARDAGLTLTDPESTMRDMQAWVQGKDLPYPFSPQREAELIQTSRRTG
jgi:2'-hydroxyisoflavone reductase